VHHYLFKQESNTSESLKKLGVVLTCYLKNPASSITSAVNKNKCIIISSEKIKSTIIIFLQKVQHLIIPWTGLTSGMELMAWVHS
jgi:predicted enzyme involved in methoxymalonyl-ACP biosynthesis